MANGTPMIRGVMPSAMPTMARAMRPAAIRPRHRVSSTRGPANPSRAGSSVSEATMVTATTVAAPTARPVTKLICMIVRPSRAMTTVMPANTTARPAVSMAMTVARSVSCPACRFSRNRVTMNRA